MKYNRINFEKISNILKLNTFSQPVIVICLKPHNYNRTFSNNNNYSFKKKTKCEVACCGLYDTCIKKKKK